MALLLGRGGLIRETEELNEDIESFDALTITRIVNGASNARQALAMAAFGKGQAAPGYSLMWCVKTSAKREKALTWECRAEYKGFARTTNPYKRTIRTFPDKTRGTITINGPLGPYSQEIEVNESMVGVTVSYILNGIPPTGSVSYPAFPRDGTVAVPTSRWTTITNPLETLPFGWVLDGIEAEQVPSTNLHFVREDYVYYQQYKPGSNSFQT